MSKARVSLDGLRTSDSDTIALLAQDVIGKTVLERIEASTLCDLMTIAGVDEGLPKQLKSDLDSFAEQMLRQIDDLHDGAGLADWANELAEVDAGLVPASLRGKVAELADKRKAPESQAALQACLEKWEGTEPVAYEVPHPVDAENKVKTQEVDAKKAPAKKKSTRRKSTTVRNIDDERVEWIRGDVMDCLVRYVPDGLKESVIVAGSRYRSPWEDLSEAEVLAVLRLLDREGLVRKSAQRWKVRQ